MGGGGGDSRGPSQDLPPADTGCHVDTASWEGNGGGGGDSRGPSQDLPPADCHVDTASWERGWKGGGVTGIQGTGDLHLQGGPNIKVILHLPIPKIPCFGSGGRGIDTYKLELLLE